jgi:hypothetical protein
VWVKKLDVNEMWVWDEVMMWSEGEFFILK